MIWFIAIVVAFITLVALSGAAVFFSRVDAMWGVCDLETGVSASVTRVHPAWLFIWFPVAGLAYWAVRFNGGADDMVAACVWGQARRAEQRGTLDRARFKRLEAYLGERFPSVEALARLAEREDDTR